MELERSCPLLYHQLPNPTFQLDYSLWMPGYAWKPEPENEEVGETKDEYSEDDMAMRLASMVEEDEMKKEFDSAAGGRGGFITANDAGNLSRKMGLAPSLEDIRNWRTTYEDKVDYKAFQKFMLACTHPEDNPDTLCEFFRHYDNSGSGTLSKKQLRNLLKMWGDPLNDAEVDIVMREYAGDSEMVNYRDFVERLLGH